MIWTGKIGALIIYLKAHLFRKQFHISGCALVFEPKKRISGNLS
ncbi:hypothetical protein CEV31_1089 [Brucella thiophenivorans]|uniref:Uncharacterized protein n=1 Tax=Brucella thiophenivorans TaxID=571255 RepID=A0A256FZ07_9HYPH|nr:hypothetical protein CEV31_1089 [Brucella thiophenivorans]